jgi:hypothetical protein
MSVEFCGRCGLAQAGNGHAECLAGLLLEPPRYCVHCRRRMVVQVVPDGWSATCSVHGRQNP